MFADRLFLRALRQPLARHSTPRVASPKSDAGSALALAGRASRPLVRFPVTSSRECCFGRLDKDDRSAVFGDVGRRATAAKMVCQLPAQRCP